MSVRRQVGGGPETLELRAKPREVGLGRVQQREHAAAPTSLEVAA